MEEQKEKHSETTNELLDEITKEAIAIGYIEPENIPPAYAAKGQEGDPNHDASGGTAAAAEGDLTEEMLNQAVSEAQEETDHAAGLAQWRARLLSLKDRLDATLPKENSKLAEPVNKIKSMANSATVDRKALVSYIIKLAAGGLAFGLIASLTVIGIPKLLADSPPAETEKPSVTEKNNLKKTSKKPVKKPASGQLAEDRKNPGQSTGTETEPADAEVINEPTIDYTVDNNETRELIRMLAALQYLSDNPVDTSPEEVKKAVYTFQKDQQLAPTGQVDLTTLGSIINKYGLFKAKETRH